MTKQPDKSTQPSARTFPPIGGPALRALAAAGIRSLDQFAQWRECELLQLHDMGPKGVRLLNEALVTRGVRLRSD